MGLQQLANEQVTHIFEHKYKNYNGVNLNNDNVVRKVNKKVDTKQVRKDMIKGYTMMNTQLVNS